MRSALIKTLLAAFVLLLNTPVFARQTPPATLEMDGAFLVHVKEQQDPAILKAVRAEADHAMDQGPFSVMQKKKTPPSGSKHDYMSLAPYWWPNPSTANGLPYVRRDGQRNPITRSIPDHANIFGLEDAVHALALGYFFTGKEEYAARAVLLLRTWFLDPTTRMNPNLNYAQAILGVNEGRGIGLIETRGLPRILDSVTLLSGSASLTHDEINGLHKWFSAYLGWLQNSPNGRTESRAKNNHGSWYDQQLIGIALFLGDKNLARNAAETAKIKRIAFQIKAGGAEPLELARTKSFSYSVFNLSALMRLARESQLAGVNLWNYRAPNGASIRAALDYLLPYAEGSKKWTHQNLNGLHPGSLTIPLLLAAEHYHDSTYLRDAEKLENKPTAEVLMLEEQARETVASQ